MVHTSLTVAPQDFKEGMDWLMALKGADPENNLKAMGAAVYDLLKSNALGVDVLDGLKKVQGVSQKFLDQEGLNKQLFVKEFLQRIAMPLNKKSDVFADCPHITAETIAENIGEVVNGCHKFLETSKIPTQYDSAYSSATWDASCSKNPKDCAVMLVGIAPMLYTGLRSLQVASHAAARKELGHEAKKRMDEVLNAVGYTNTKSPDKMGSSTLYQALNDVDEKVLSVLHDLAGFWAFDVCDNKKGLKVKRIMEPKDVKSVDPEAEPSVDGEGEQYVIPEAEPTFEGEGEQSVIPEAEPTFEGEGEQSVIPEAEPTFEGEGEQSVIPEAEPTFEGEGEQSLIPEAEPTFDGEGEQSVIPEAEPSVEPAGEEPVIPEAEPSVEPVKPEGDEDTKAAGKNPAKMAKVARSVKAAKKAAKKVSKKARQKKQKKHKKQQESTEQ
ncbi:hypothetical protein BBBOND_0201690 [Babesia bigemina]|uniref:Uncharacterized protein n=1 Tax=Babesia bigemina TaxID=5866 RepID=A0A061D4N6_BABBI|nr:hypothetical protein BBBOND_0201690 [Babesia bigemina]CDR95012.1 hypothetical protein BBBOND_0201690 [Babesia bigemina]|eukprot:XP_012767198.1 hypothetical protein BBBOND_0201690 [Babesia bigemina]